MSTLGDIPDIYLLKPCYSVPSIWYNVSYRSEAALLIVGEGNCGIWKLKNSFKKKQPCLYIMHLKHYKKDWKIIFPPLSYFLKCQASLCSAESRTLIQKNSAEGTLKSVIYTIAIFSFLSKVDKGCWQPLITEKLCLT